jgi:hypothetical protein
MWAHVELHAMESHVLPPASLGRSGRPTEKGSDPFSHIRVVFTEWTAGGNLRHAWFVGVRQHKPAP